MQDALARCCTKLAREYDVLTDRSDIDRTGQAQCPAERTTPLREVEASRIEVHMGTTAGKATMRVGGEARPDLGRDPRVSGCAVDDDSE